jgi:hypothetical protein
MARKKRQPLTKADLEQLVRAMLPHAKQALEDQGSFAPFGGALLPTGEIERIECDETKTAPSPAAELVEKLDVRLRGGANRGDFRATAALVHVQVRQPGGEPRDAVQVKLDHCTGASLELFFPYRLKRPGLATFGRAFSRDGGGDIFE